MHITTKDITMNKKRRNVWYFKNYGQKIIIIHFFSIAALLVLSIDLTMFPLQIYIFFIALNAMDKNKNIITTPVRDGSWGDN